MPNGYNHIYYIHYDVARFRCRVTVHFGYIYWLYFEKFITVGPIFIRIIFEYPLYILKKKWMN